MPIKRLTKEPLILIFHETNFAQNISRMHYKQLFKQVI
jgi:hypothetical protein